MTRVVLADDHPLFLQALREAVEQAGIDVVGLATRGDDLVELVKTTETDAVLLDLSMPGYDGFECIDRIRRLDPDVALIVVSGSASELEVNAPSMQAHSASSASRSTRSSSPGPCAPSCHPTS